MLLRLWMLVLLVCVSAFAPSRAEARAAQNRTWVFAPQTTETRLENEPQVAGTHQENGLWNYEHAPGCCLAAESEVVSLHRPYIRNWVMDEVEAAAPRAPDGRFIDPNTRLPTDNPVLGHKPGYEFWRLRDAAEAEGVSQKLFNETLNNPEFYQIEDSASNASHLFEQP
jgi:hypothetical protein